MQEAAQLRKGLLGVGAAASRNRAQVSYELSAAVDEIGRLEGCLASVGPRTDTEQLQHAIGLWRSRIDALGLELRALQPLCFLHSTIRPHRSQQIPEVVSRMATHANNSSTSTDDAAIGQQTVSSSLEQQQQQQKQLTASPDAMTAALQQDALAPSSSLAHQSSSPFKPPRRSSRALRCYVDSDLRAMGVYRPLPIVRQMPLSVIRRMKCNARRIKERIRDRNANRRYEVALWLRVGRLLLTRMRVQARAGALWRRWALRKPFCKWRSVSSQTLLATERAVGLLHRVQYSTSVGRCFYAWAYLTKVCGVVLRRDGGGPVGDVGSLGEEDDHAALVCHCDGLLLVSAPPLTAPSVDNRRELCLRAIAETIDSRAACVVAMACLAPADRFMSRAKCFVMERVLERLRRTVPLTKAFLEWRRYTRCRIAKQQLHARAIAFRTAHSAATTFFRWRNAAVVHHARQRKLRVTLLACVAAWRAHALGRSLERRSVGAFVAGVDGRLQRRLFMKWKRRTLSPLEQEALDAEQAAAIAQQCNAVAYLALFSVLSTWSVCAEVAANPVVRRVYDLHVEATGGHSDEATPSLVRVATVLAHPSIVGQLSIDAQWLLARARMIACFLRWRLLQRWTRRVHALLSIAGDVHLEAQRRSSSSPTSLRSPQLVRPPQRASSLACAVSKLLFGNMPGNASSLSAGIVGDDVVDVVARHVASVAPLLLAPAPSSVGGDGDEAQAPSYEAPHLCVSYAALVGLAQHQDAIRAWACDMEALMPGILQPYHLLSREDDGAAPDAEDDDAKHHDEDSSSDERNNDGLPVSLQAAPPSDDDAASAPQPRTRGELLAAMRLHETRLIGGLGCRMAAARYAFDTSTGALLGFTATKVEVNLHELFVKKKKGPRRRGSSSRHGKQSKQGRSGTSPSGPIASTAGQTAAPRSATPPRAISPRTVLTPPLSATSKPNTARRHLETVAVVLPSFSGEHIIAVSTLGTTSVGGTQHSVGDGGGVLAPPTPSPSPLPPPLLLETPGPLSPNAPNVVVREFFGAARTEGAGGDGDAEGTAQGALTASLMLGGSDDAATPAPGGADAGGLRCASFVSAGIPRDPMATAAVSHCATSPVDDAGLELELIAAASHAAMLPPADLYSPRWGGHDGVHDGATEARSASLSLYHQIEAPSSPPGPWFGSRTDGRDDDDTGSCSGAPLHNDGMPPVVIPTALTDAADLSACPPQEKGVMPPPPRTAEGDGAEVEDIPCMPNSVRTLQCFAWEKRRSWIGAVGCDGAAGSRLLVEPQPVPNECSRQVARAGTLYGAREMSVSVPHAGFPAQSLRRRRHSLKPPLDRRAAPPSSTMDIKPKRNGGA